MDAADVEIDWELREAKRQIEKEELDKQSDKQYNKINGK